ncbi:MAG: thiopurine S-methyltransferase [Wenzhouxiangellaceae bacterium]|nr:thiopurine S-methyltransferase [Wenzhouxiangellaceae bacterium]
MPILPAMDPDFWHDRWRQDRIGFHLESVHWALERYWARVADDRTDRVLVPLCGKTVDMRWLAGRGHPVTGIELSEKAAREFFHEWGRTPARRADGSMVRWSAANVEFLEGDFFEFSPARRFSLVYDRAALIALPPDLRPRYLRRLRELLAEDAAGLLVTLEYDQRQMDGPPFSVHESELAASTDFCFELLERRDVLAGHERFAERGLASLDECVYRIEVRTY